MRVLVTGGSGFIGSAVCRHLVLDRGWSVVNVDKLTYAANPASLAAVDGSPAYRFVHLDICDRAALAHLIADSQPGAILNLAAETHVDRSISGPSDFIRTNIVGTFTLLEAACAYWAGLSAAKRATFRLLHVSTDEVFGSLPPGHFFTEATRYDPRSPYSASKAASDHLVAAWHATYGLPVITTNCSNNYGPYQFPEKLIPLVILNALENRSLPVYGDGLHERDWLYVEDHARALALVMEKGRVGETYAIGGRATRTNIEVVEKICEIVDRLRPGTTSRRSLITLVEDRPGHDRRYAIDPTKFETEIGWRAGETFETGLEKTVAWYLDNEAWWRPLRQRVYQGQRLGLVKRPEHELSAGTRIPR